MARTPVGKFNGAFTPLKTTDLATVAMKGAIERAGLAADQITEVVEAVGDRVAVGVDANQGWRVDNAIRVANATRDLDFILEQPCRTYDECQQVRRHVAQPMKLDECVTGIDAAQRIVRDRGAEICCLKISNLGGLSKARRVRDYLVENRIPVVSEDTWGGEITTAALAHFAASTPPATSRPSSRSWPGSGSPCWCCSTRPARRGRASSATWSAARVASDASTSGSRTVGSSRMPAICS